MSDVSRPPSFPSMAQGAPADFTARDRSSTLAASPPHAHPQASSLKLKLPTQAKQRPDPSPAPSSSGIDFSLPSQASRPLVPARPGVQKPMKPGPKRQADVDEDYSNTKAPNQVLFTTFWTSVEPYLREIREDDLAMLGFKADAPESYEIPPRGRHYTEVWDEEDGALPGTTPRVSVPNMRLPPAASGKNPAAPAAHFVPATELKDENLMEEFKGLGNITERVVAAVVPDPDTARAKAEAVKGKAAEEGSGGREAARVDVADLEDRMKRELRSVMLLGEHEEVGWLLVFSASKSLDVDIRADPQFDPSKRDDDEITSALRTCQRQLLHQTTLNDARKSRLAEIAKHRLAFTEYSSALEGIEKSIEAGWAKRIKKYGLTPKKTNAGSGERPARPPVPEELKRLVATRQKWLDTVGLVMKERKGEVFGLPSRSIYEGIEGEIEERDERTVDDAVEVDDGDDE